MNHVVLRDPSLNGWEYGMLRSFEGSIVKHTGASLVELPDHHISPRYLRHFGHGMTRGVYRKHFPKQPFNVRADVGWCILMGPENYRLDLYNEWEKGIKTKILYLFDTLPSQYDLIRRLFKNNEWDLLITAFNDAVPDLERITKRKWHFIEQAADNKLFQPVPFDKRVIHFSAYGRRDPVMHEVLIQFCAKHGLYYDYTTHDAKHPTVDAPELYTQYAWHLSHSLFTVSWPVEFTNPARAGHLHPITCRWFEAASAGTVILGKQPDNPVFEDVLQPGLVVNIDARASREHILNQLEAIWENRNVLSASAMEASRQFCNSWSWDERVMRIISWLGKN
jgi:Glycosyl transferases group 1